MKKILISMMIIVFGFQLTNPSPDNGREITMDVFPDLTGWQKKGNPELYRPDNLFEYINGAAEVYLSYDFQKLRTLTYQNQKNQSFTIDLYQHSNTNTGFGIYSQEKPERGNFLKIGTQGYYEKGTLNFFKDQFYVKLSGFDLADEDRLILEKAAYKIEKNLIGDNIFPKPLSCFPIKSKIENSERYIFKNFLGHSFLHSAFVTDYESQNKKFQVFIIETENSQAADKILEKYLNFVKKKGVIPELNNGMYRFSDPYYRSSGKMNLKKNNNYLWGLFGDDINLTQFYIYKIEKNLKAHQLIK